VKKNFKKTIVVAGWYGTGKTEFCVNLALSLKRDISETIYLADLDVINPYFRSRDKADFLKSHGIEIIGNNINDSLNQDIPALDNKALRHILQGDNLIVDLAGSLNGLKPLSIFKRHLKEGEYDFFVVLNAFRSDVNTIKTMIEFIQNAEIISALKVTGIINNSHLLHMTTPELILESQELIEKVSQKVNIPIKLTLVKTEIYNIINNKITSPILTFDELIMRKDWQN